LRKESGMETHTPDEEVPVVQEAREEDLELLPELVTHLRDGRTELREQWANRITNAHLLSAMTDEEIFSLATSVYDNYVEVLVTGSVEALQAYARDLSERIIPRGVETYEVVGIVLLLRDVLARSLFEKYQKDFELLNRVLDAYEPAANRIANTVAVSFVRERERVIRQQQDAIRDLPGLRHGGPRNRSVGAESVGQLEETSTGAVKDKGLPTATMTRSEEESTLRTQVEGVEEVP